MKVKPAPVGLDAVVPALTQTVERLESFQRKGIHQPPVGENGQRGGDISTVAELLEKARSLSVPQVQGTKPKRSAEKLGQAAVAVSLRQRLVDFEQLAPQNLRPDDAEAMRQSTLSLLSYWRKEVSCQEALNRDDSKAVLGRVLERTMLDTDWSLTGLVEAAEACHKISPNNPQTVKNAVQRLRCRFM